MLEGFTTNKALLALLGAAAALQLPDDAPQWAKFVVLGASWLLTFLVPNKGAAEVKGEHEAD